MHYGFRIVEDMIDGLNDYLDAKGIASVGQLTGAAMPNVQPWESLEPELQARRADRITIRA